MKYKVTILGVHICNNCDEVTEHCGLWFSLLRIIWNIAGHTWKLKAQLDATDLFLYCKTYCSLNMFQAPLCPSSGVQELYRWLLPVILGAVKMERCNLGNVSDG